MAWRLVKDDDDDNDDNLPNSILTCSHIFHSFLRSTDTYEKFRLFTNQHKWIVISQSIY
jgi:hypothetical protein